MVSTSGFVLEMVTIGIFACGNVTIAACNVIVRMVTDDIQKAWAGNLTLARPILQSEYSDAVTGNWEVRRKTSTGNRKVINDPIAGNREVRGKSSTANQEVIDAHVETSWT